MISSPVLFLCGWLAWGAWSTHAAYCDAAGAACPMTTEIFHLNLHDRLRQDIRRMSMPPPPEPPSLPVYSLLISRADSQTLSSNLSADSQRPYVPVFVSKGGGQFLPARARVRGGPHWHWAHPQKSLKIAMDSGAALEGEDVFNLINEVAPISVGEPVVLEVLRGLGVLAPDSRLVRVVINKRPMGVYLFSGHAEAGLLRKNGRMPGSIFSGDDAPVDSATGLGTLFRDPRAWTKAASSGPGKAGGMAEIERLIEKVNKAGAAEFAAFAKDELDLGKFAAFDAVDAAFGGNQHDARSNHKIYFDAYKGRFEPIGWNFRGWRHEPLFQPVEHPLRLKLAHVPGYLALRNRILYGLLNGPCAVSEIRSRLLGQIKLAAPEYAADPYWDAYRLLPPVNRELRRLVRPMDEERQALILESEIKTFAERSAFLLRGLEEDGITLRLGRKEAREAAAALEVEVTGRGAYRLESAGVDFRPGPGVGGGWRLWRDLDLDGAFDPGADQALADESSGGSLAEDPGLLIPAARTVARADPSPEAGNVTISPAPRIYRFFIEAGEGMEAANLKFRNEVTGWSFQRTVRAGDWRKGTEAPAPAGSPGSVQRFAAEETDVHPWLLEERRGLPVRLGPGEVLIEKTRVFRETEPVFIAAGTAIRLSPGASLVFRGRVEAAGTEEQPVSIEPVAGGTSFGGIALQGRGASGSVLRCVRIQGATAPEWNLASYPAALNVHDAGGVVISGCVFRAARDSADAVHLGYAQDAVIENCRFEGMKADALDLEFSSARITSCNFRNPGEEAVDMMASTAEILDCIVTGAGGNAISVGERSSAQIRGCLAASCRKGLLVKSRSEAVVACSLFFRCGLAVELETRSPKYGGRSEVRGETLDAVECGGVFKSDDGSAPGFLRVMTDFPPDDSLGHLLKHVLGLEKWDDLAGLVGRMRN